MQSLLDWVTESKKQGLGKWVGNCLYIHRSAIDLKILPCEAKEVAEREIADWNVIKVSLNDNSVSFLCYLDFDTEPHPILDSTLTYHLKTGKYRKATYDININPPILHRKELLVDGNYPYRSDWESLTEQEEALGLYEETKTIGFLQNWKALLARKGMLKNSKSSSEIQKKVVDRHKTAIARSGLSRPMQTLLQEGLLAINDSLFDYGCGRGDDFSLLKKQGFDASGWDPIHFTSGIKKNADIVNLGYVLNVIEDPAERIEVLANAFSYADRVLSVAVLIENMQTAQILKPYGDGFLTSKNTFQKYYNQIEFAQLIEDVLQCPQVVLGPGHVAVFKNTEYAEEFLIKKSTKKYSSRLYNYKISWNKQESDELKKDLFFQENEHLIERYWAKTIDLGRFPFQDEFDDIESLHTASGSMRRLQSWVISHYGSDVFEKALQEKREDIIVYLALRHFQKKLPLRMLPKRIQNDIRACFSSFNSAWSTANHYLFQIGNPKIITERCDNSTVGRINPQALWVKPDAVNKLDPVLRIYVHVGSLFYGNLNDAHEIKIHKASGKITFLQYEDPTNDHPKTTIRVKVDLGRQKVEYYDHR